ncbi:MAG: putative lipid II flippase FtsW [Candidatus Eremiobacteraeota bacterium]|nr:putative lipid II flippase FtsW [Candidatus Eremiobacteraeota bacterium]
MAERTGRSTLSTAPDTVMVATVATLVAFGLVMIFSASSAYAVALHHDALYFLKRQLAWLAVATVLSYVAYRIDYRKLRGAAPALLAINVGVLILVLLPHVGAVAGGARRWVGVGPVQFEPSEFVKLALVLYLAAALATKGAKIRSFTSGVAPLCAVTALAVYLIIRQPDMGTASLLVFTAATMLFVAGARIAHLLAVAAVVVPSAFLLARHDPYKWARITAFVNPWKDPQDKGFHIVQSLLALGSGGWHGVGLGFSRQKYFWLPEAHTDFIGSIVGEELGFVGIALLIALFVTFAYRSVRIALGSEDRFGFFLAIGAMATVVIQAFVNLGVVSSSWPVTGVPLPFISFGGSSLITSLLASALIVNVGRPRRSALSARARARSLPSGSYEAPRRVSASSLAR